MVPRGHRPSTSSATALAVRLVGLVRRLRTPQVVLLLVGGLTLDLRAVADAPLRLLLVSAR